MVRSHVFIEPIIGNNSNKIIIQVSKFLRELLRYENKVIYYSQFSKQEILAHKSKKTRDLTVLTF